MKLTTLLLFAALMQVSAKNSNAQKITFTAKNTDIVKVFDQISDQSGYGFVITKSVIDHANKVTLSVKEVDLKEVLKMIFKNQPLEYSIDNNTVLVKNKNASILDHVINRFTALDVKGRVVSENNEPFQGVNISVKGTSQQTSTNKDGYFFLSGVDEGTELEISFLGYKTQTRKVSSNMGTIKLEMQVDELKEVTVSTGYQTLSKERVTGSFSTIPAKKLEQQRLSSLGSILEGRVAGYNNGLIRGTSSMNGVSNPLYVVDGFPIENTTYDPVRGTVEGIPGLNLEDIESITVLKDAAAASIYGARATNGVVVIVTKKGKKGGVQISASSTFTYSPYRLYTDNLTSSADIIELEKEWAANNPNFKGNPADISNYANSLLDNAAYPNQGTNAILRNYAGTLSNADLNAKLNQLSASGYQYYKDVEKYSKRDVFFQQYNLNVGTATEKNSFYSSVTYRNNKLEDKYNDDQSLGVNINNTLKLTKWLTLELSNYFQYGSATSQPNNTLSPGYTFLPYDRLVNADGSHFTSAASSRLSVYTQGLINNFGLYNMDINPLDEQALNLGKTKNFSNRSYIKIKADLASWISYNSTFQYEYANDRLNQLFDKNSYYVRNLVNSYAGLTDNSDVIFNLPYGNINSRQVQNRTAFNFRQQFNIDKTFGGKHNLTAIIGTETRHNFLEFESQRLYNYDPQILSFDLINAKTLANVPGAILGGGNFTADDISSQREAISRFVSVYSNAGYAYDEKYLLTGSLRLDRSNLWGTNSKYQNKPLWSIGAGWNLHKEAFFDIDWVNLLKVRASRGISGNIATDAAPYTIAYYFPNFNLGGLQGTITDRPNPLLSWEKTTTTNAGLDFSILNSRITGSLDYYVKNGRDLLANTTGVPTEGYGYSTYRINNGEMRNKGFEISLSGDIIKTAGLTWNASVLYAHNKNKVTYVNVKAPVYYLQLDYPQAYPRIGNPYNAIYSYKWAGLSGEGLPQVYNAAGEKVQVSPGDLESIAYAGSAVPINSGSVNSLLSYKNFTFSFLLTYETGHKMRNTFLPMLTNDYNNALGGYVSKIGVVNKDIVNRWRVPGDENRTNIPRTVFAEDPSYNSESYDLYQNADINVIDASNLRMRNISLAYTLSKSLSKKVGLENVRFQFNAENLFTVAASKEAKFLLNGYRYANYVWGVYLNF